MSRNPGPIPNRWLNCPRKSESIIAERFIAFKTPLSNDYNGQMPIECVFPPSMIFGYCKTLKLKLGLWIDLTNTKRFYDREQVESRGAKYVKLQCRGHGETPSPEQTRSFIEIVDQFTNDRPLDIIAVHCTHGFNRTGFLIASYLVERMDCAVEGALSMFAAARPPGIYKQDYIVELFRRYEDEEDAIPAPQLPDWCLEYDDSNGADDNNRKRPHESQASSASLDNEGALGEDDVVEDDADGDEADADGEASTSNGGKPRKKRRREMVIKNATFMSGVPGVTLVTEQPLLGTLQAKVQDMCGWSKSGFPGAQPVSMDMRNLPFLKEKPYRVSWKADGTRYMMLINDRDEVYFFDRNNSCFQVSNLSFPVAGKLSEHLKDTLVDGEMVLDKYKGTVTPRYLIYDVIKICNRNIGAEPFFPNRLQCVRKEVIEPRYEAISKGIIDKQSEPFSVRNKDFWEIQCTASLLSEKFTKQLSHEPDGLIFQPAKEPYTAGACKDVLKWKPHDMNSIDFRLKIVVESGMGLLTSKIGCLYVGGHDEPFAKMKYTKALKDLDNKIIECTVNAEGLWEFMRERTDKSLPNSYNTAVSVCESIRHPITKRYLIEYIHNCGYRSDSDIMPPPQSQRRPPGASQNHGQHPQQQQQHHQHHGQQPQHQQQMQRQQQYQQPPAGHTQFGQP